MAGRGHNALHGPDLGPPPPGFNGPPGIPQYGVPVAAPAYGYGYPPPMPAPYPLPQPAYPYPHGYPTQATYTHPAFPPAVNPDFPGINLANHLGGYGVPPGYNYIFPSEHTIIHVLRCASKPWQVGSSISPHDPTTHTKFYVPVETNVKEFMKRIGCDDKDDSKNVVWEVVEKGNGAWASGMCLRGGNKDLMKKNVGDLGWRANRNGRVAQGGLPVVWLWREKA